MDPEADVGQAKETRRQSSLGLGNLFSNRFGTLWTPTEAGDPDAGGNDKARGRSAFAGKMKRLLSPKPQRDLQRSSVCDLPLPGQESPESSAPGRTPGRALGEVARSWPVLASPGGSNSLWKKLVDKGGKGASQSQSNGPDVLAHGEGDDLSDSGSFGSTAASPCQGGQLGAAADTSSVSALDDRFYSYNNSPVKGIPAYVPEEQTVDLQSQAFLFPVDDMGPNTPGMPATSAGLPLTPPFLPPGPSSPSRFGNTPVDADDQTLVLVSGMQLKRAGCGSTLMDSPMLFGAPPPGAATAAMSAALHGDMAGDATPHAGVVTCSDASPGLASLVQDMLGISGGPAPVAVAHDAPSGSGLDGPSPTLDDAAADSFSWSAAAAHAEVLAHMDGERDGSDDGADPTSAPLAGAVAASSPAAVGTQQEHWQEQQGDSGSAGAAAGADSSAEPEPQAGKQLRADCNDVSSDGDDGDGNSTHGCGFAASDQPAQHEAALPGCASPVGSAEDGTAPAAGSSQECPIELPQGSAFCGADAVMCQQLAPEDAAGNAISTDAEPAVGGEHAVDCTGNGHEAAGTAAAAAEPPHAVAVAEVPEQALPPVPAEEPPAEAAPPVLQRSPSPALSAASSAADNGAAAVHEEGGDLPVVSGTPPCPRSAEPAAQAVPVDEPPAEAAPPELQRSSSPALSAAGSAADNSATVVNEEGGDPPVDSGVTAPPHTVGAAAAALTVLPADQPPAEAAPPVLQRSRSPVPAHSAAGSAADNSAAAVNEEGGNLPVDGGMTPCPSSAAPAAQVEPADEPPAEAAPPELQRSLSPVPALSAASSAADDSPLAAVEGGGHPPVDSSATPRPGSAAPSTPLPPMGVLSPLDDAVHDESTPVQGLVCTMDGTEPTPNAGGGAPTAQASAPKQEGSWSSSPSSPGFGFAQGDEDTATPRLRVEGAPSPTMQLGGADYSMSLMDEDTATLLPMAPFAQVAHPASPSPMAAAAAPRAMPAAAATNRVPEAEDATEPLSPPLISGSPPRIAALPQPRRTPGRHDAVRESIPLFVKGTGAHEAASGLLDDEWMEDLGPLRGSISQGAGNGSMFAAGNLGGGAQRVMPHHASTFVSRLTPVAEAPLGSPDSDRTSGSEQEAPPSGGSAAQRRQVASPAFAAAYGARAVGGSALRATPPPAPSGARLRPSPPSAGSASAAAAAAISSAAASPVLADDSNMSPLDQAVSPRLVYAARFTATPYRQMAALPMAQALAAPLVDSSPFALDEVDNLDTICLADEAKRVVLSLAPMMGAAGGGAASTRGSAGGADGARGDRSESPSDKLHEMHVQMLTKELTAAEARCVEVEQQNEALRDQVAALQFEKQASESNDEFEREARLYAEEQLRGAQGEVARLQERLAVQQAALAEALDQGNQLREEALAAAQSWQRDRAHLESQINQANAERDAALDQVNFADVRLTAMQSANADLQAALGAEQLRVLELSEAVAAREGEAREAARAQGEARAQLERAMGQLIAAQTAREHANRKAMEDHQHIGALTQQVQQLVAEQEKVRQEAALLRQKYAQRSAQAKELHARVMAKEQENGELMAMCDQLMALQEAGRS